MMVFHPFGIEEAINKMSFNGLNKIGQINIPVRDLEQGVNYYRDTLGMEFLFQVPGMAFFDCGGIRILLNLPEDDTHDHQSSIIYFDVDDIHTATDALLERGVTFFEEPHLVAEMPDHDLWMSFFEDPDQNTLALMSEVGKVGRGERSG
jgi:catechol 2,3-dioxygenase-like lactoylglutathione lyase family enzyme